MVASLSMFCRSASRQRRKEIVPRPRNSSSTLKTDCSPGFTHLAHQGDPAGPSDAGQCWKGPFHQHFQGPRLGGRVGEAWLIPSDCVQTAVQHGLLITRHLENHVTSLQPSSAPTQVNFLLLL